MTGGLRASRRGVQQTGSRVRLAGSRVRRAGSRARRRPLAGALAAVLAASLAACGAEPPQPPLAYAKKLDAATSGISTACGEAYQLTAFGGPHAAGLGALEADASQSVDKLALVYHRDPAWIYQGQTVRQIVGASLSLLRSCGLDRARARLVRQTTRAS